MIVMDRPKKNTTACPGSEFCCPRMDMQMSPFYQLCQHNSIIIVLWTVIGSKSTGVLSWETDQGRHVAALCCLVFWHWEFVQLALQCRGSPRLDRLEAGPKLWLGYGKGTHVWLLSSLAGFWMAGPATCTSNLDNLHMIKPNNKTVFLGHAIVFYSFQILPECRKPKRCLKWSSRQNAELFDILTGLCRVQKQFWLVMNLEDSTCTITSNRRRKPILSIFHWCSTRNRSQQRSSKPIRNPLDFALLRWRKMRFTHIGRSTGSSWAVATSIQTRKNVRVLSKHVKACFIWFVFWWGELVRSESDVTGHPLEGYSGYSMYIVYRIYIYT